MNLSDLITQGPVSGTRRWLLEHALSAPWCWPVDSRLERLALAAGLVPPAPVPPGEVCLLTVSGRKGGLWWLRPRSMPEAHHLAGPLKRTADRALQVATRDLRLIADTRPLQAPPEWSATLIAVSRHGEAEHSLQGDSLGLAIQLAAASLLTRQAVAGDLAATATVHPSGRLGPVGALAEKAGALADWGLGVRRLIVCAEQRARHLTRSLPREVE